MDTSKENSGINTTTYQTAEKTPNIKETSNQNNEQISQNINYLNILDSQERQEHQVNYKRPASESTCVYGDSLSPKPPPFNIETHEILLAKNNSNKDKTFKNNQNPI